MKKPVAFLALLFIGFGCSKESFLRLDNADFILMYVPDYSNPKSFSDGEDTLALSLISQDTWYETAPGTQGAGSLGDFDRLELQHSEMVIGIDTPYYARIGFEVETMHYPASPSDTKDLLTVSLRKSGTEILEQLQLENIDSVKCISENCSFADTLMLDSITYYNVYYIAGDSSEPALYINRDQGLVGFKTETGKLYKRLK